MNSEKDVLFKECIDSYMKMKKSFDFVEILEQSQQNLGAEIQKYYCIKDGEMTIDVDFQTLENIIINNMKQIAKALEKYNCVKE
ncbi:hypothetical protein [Clostridium botulinum]|uniref:hypothetical protein n=1 Tax=Clostridium botulinum TaxID=1491 RepID=UPI00174B6516|nr:hypothetical protein [Clostridium botulinum]MBD5589276.1 hypothetical protein [Clostridium botulinum]